MRAIVTPCFAAAVLTAAAASAQPPAAAPPVATEGQHGWSLQIGYESFTMRDISRNGRPPDASPIAWKGEGPAVISRYAIHRPKSTHQIEAGFRQARSFTYEAPTQSFDAPGDRASQLAARYEYRRYIWRDLGLDGFDLGLGAQGTGIRQVIDRHITASLRATTTIAGGGGAGVVVARFQRWDRVHLAAAWSNGAIVSHRTAAHSAVSEADTFWGGNFLTDTELRADVKLTRAARLAVSWRRYFELYGSDHFSYSGVWQSLNVGVLYAR